MSVTLSEQTQPSTARTVTLECQRVAIVEQFKTWQIK